MFPRRRVFPRNRVHPCKPRRNTCLRFCTHAARARSSGARGCCDYANGMATSSAGFMAPGQLGGSASPEIGQLGAVGWQFQARRSPRRLYGCAPEGALLWLSLAVGDGILCPPLHPWLRRSEGAGRLSFALRRPASHPSPRVRSSLSGVLSPIAIWQIKVSGLFIFFGQDSAACWAVTSPAQK